jgi:hypothetical protein
MRPDNLFRFLSQEESVVCSSYGDGRIREEGNDKVGSGTGVLGTHGYDSDDARPSGAISIMDSQAQRGQLSVLVESEDDASIMGLPSYSRPEGDLKEFSKMF